MPSGRRPRPAGIARQRKPGRLLVYGRRRAARRGERFIAEYEFPAYIWKRVRKRVPELDEEGLRLAELGLREWFICCAWRGRPVLGMPSRIVDEAWHEFILDSISYTDFCRQAFGGYLHHTPDEAMGTPMARALDDTVRAWDRSEMGRDRESVLWDLDEQLRIKEPLGVNGVRLVSARSGAPYAAATGWACAGGFAGSGAPAHHGGCAGGGCAGGGCSGGGCGGGCGGGGCGGGGS
jgi:hypothetical protein